MIPLTIEEIEYLKQKSKESFASMKALNKGVFKDEMDVDNLEDIVVNIVQLSLTFFHEYIETPHIDIKMMVLYKDVTLGRYHLIFNSSLEIIDDFLIFD